MFESGPDIIVATILRGVPLALNSVRYIPEIRVKLCDAKKLHSDNLAKFQS
jgi:hypothetical protein